MFCNIGIGCLMYKDVQAIYIITIILSITATTVSKPLDKRLKTFPWYKKSQKA